MQRLPKKRGNSYDALEETAYQGWKFASLGFIPAIISGRTVAQACKDSLSLVKHQLLPLAKLRLGYSIVCWITGIACYLATAFNMDQMHAFFGIEQKTSFSFHMLVGIPLLITLLILIVFIRPLYIISAARIYANYTDINNIRRNLPDSASSMNADWFVLFLLIALLSSFIYFKETAKETFLIQPKNLVHKLNYSATTDSAFDKKTELIHDTAPKTEKADMEEHKSAENYNAIKEPAKDSYHYKTNPGNPLQAIGSALEDDYSDSDNQMQR